MKKLLITTIAVMLLVGCATTKNVSTQQAKDVLHDFFNHLNIDKYDRNTFKRLVTDDFQIFETGIKMSRSEFFNFIESTHSESSVSQEWVLSNFRISTDNQSAHISYRNEGIFVLKNEDEHEETLKINWLENAYLVKSRGVLKIKFLHSEVIKKKTTLRKHGAESGEELQAEGN